MKKLLFTIAMGLVGMTAYGQTDYHTLTEYDLRDVTHTNYYSGLELQTYAKHHYTGLGLTIGGSGLTLIGVGLISNSLKQAPIYSPTYYDVNTGQSYSYITGYETQINQGQRVSGYMLSVIGGVMGLIGTYYTIEAPIHIKRAGLILNGNGVGVKIKL